MPYFDGLHDLANTETTDLCALHLSKRSHLKASGGRAPLLPDDLKEETVRTPSAQVEIGVPAVLEQKTTILWKCLYLLASLKDSPDLGEAYETNRRGEEENLVHRRNITVNVDKIGGFRPPNV